MSLAIRPRSKYVGTCQRSLRYFWLLVLPMLHACSLFQATPEAPLVEGRYNWSQVEPALRALDHWSLKGKLGVRTREDAFSAAINNWVQTDDQFVIDLASTFMNLGATRLAGNSHYIVLTESGEPPLESDQPQQILTEVLGGPLPIDQLRYWIKGIPAPDNEYQIEYNEAGLAAKLIQGGWQIRFKKYQQIGALPLPGKVILEKSPNRIVVAIHNWQL